VDRYIEPFFGSGAVLLGNPYPAKSELINDINHHVANLWRALQHEPEKVWQLASAPSSEIELKARAKWLKEWVPYDFSDMNAYDAYAAGVWLWVACVAIRPDDNNLHRNGQPRGIKGREFTRDWFDNVSNRLCRIEVLCGDWKRCLTKATIGIPANFNNVGVFLDPPYGIGNNVFYDDNTGNIAKDVWEWAIENGDNPNLRIVVAGYDDGRELPKGWGIIERSEHGGYADRNKNENRYLERLWCSPHCQRNQPSLFE
jgi:DNA adenine methylase